MLRSDALATQRTQRLNGGPSQVSLPFFRGAPPWLRRTSRSVAVPERKRWDAGRRLGYAREEGVRHILCVWPAQASEAAYTRMSRQWPVAYGKRERMGGNGREEGQCNSVGLEVGGGRRRRESDDSVTNTEFTRVLRVSRNTGDVTSGCGEFQGRRRTAARARTARVMARPRFPHREIAGTRARSAMLSIRLGRRSHDPGAAQTPCCVSIVPVAQG
ncbi:hypothetical protein PCL_06702 [Purpureocillium lilacinum]|uniref:Uncharacterized protein n=1 Tax=Purpureocillium lilacinum TaxID=33203 RepID=A0A2U3DU06_PURLI|nr:hypothetical protein PCL_06702 [Purpureocillium lilacinum]